MAQYYNFISEVYRRTECAIVVTGGNHDSPAHLEAPRQVLSALRVHVIGRLPEDIGQAVIALPNAREPKLIVAALPFLRDGDLRVAMGGETRSEIERQLVAGIRGHYERAAEHGASWKSAGVPVIAMGHLTVKSCDPCPDSERDIHIGGLGSVGPDVFGDSFDYVALGHLHQPQDAERSHIRYAGSPIPLSFKEAEHEKEVRLLEFTGGKLSYQQGIPVPMQRRLIQWELRRDELELHLRGLPLPESPLRPWVEVIVTDPKPGENIFEIVRELAEGRPYDVIRVGRPPVELTATLVLAENAADEEADNLLGDPQRVFSLCLKKETTLTEEDVEALEAAFAELLEHHHEQEESGVNVPVETFALAAV